MKAGHCLQTFRGNFYYRIKKSVCRTIDVNTFQGLLGYLQCAHCFVCLLRQRNHMLLEQWGYQTNSLLRLVAEDTYHLTYVKTAVKMSK